MLRDTWACPGSEDKPAQGPWCGVLGVARKLQPFVVAPVWAMSEVRLGGGMGRGQGTDQQTLVFTLKAPRSRFWNRHVSTGLPFHFI